MTATLKLNQVWQFKKSWQLTIKSVLDAKDWRLTIEADKLEKLSKKEAKRQDVINGNYVVNYLFLSKCIGTTHSWIMWCILITFSCSDWSCNRITGKEWIEVVPIFFLSHIFACYCSLVPFNPFFVFQVERCLMRHESFFFYMYHNYACILEKKYGT
jgi:hypothetical protein